MTKPKKKEPTFRKEENGMIFTSDDYIAIGLPTEVETRTSAGGGISIRGGKAEGEKYSKITYDWRVISGSPLPFNEMKKLRRQITITSGTVVASLDNATIVATVNCKKCGTANLGFSKFCSNCGNPLQS